MQQGHVVETGLFEATTQPFHQLDILFNSHHMFHLSSQGQGQGAFSRSDFQNRVISRKSRKEYDLFADGGVHQKILSQSLFGPKGLTCFM